MGGRLRLQLISADNKVRYILLQPLLIVFTKSSTAALQSVLHVLFLPTPFKSRSQKLASTTSTTDGKGKSIADLIPEEVLKPGALYSECAVVHLKVALPELPDESKDEPQKVGGQEGIVVSDDGELGGELAGRLVWEAFEEELKRWEAANAPEVKLDENPVGEQTIR